MEKQYTYNILLKLSYCTHPYTHMHAPIHTRTHTDVHAHTHKHKRTNTEKMLTSKPQTTSEQPFISIKSKRRNNQKSVKQECAVAFKNDENEWEKYETSRKQITASHRT